MTSKTDRSPRQTTHLEFISQFTTDIQHVKGKENVVADFLSRIGGIDETSIKVALELKTLQELQEGDEELLEFKKRKRTKNSKLKLQEIEYPLSQGKLWCEVSTGTNRPFVPYSLRRTVFEKLHNLSHPRIRGARKNITARYFWPNMNKDLNH